MPTRVEIAPIALIVKAAIGPGESRTRAGRGGGRGWRARAQGLRLAEHCPPLWRAVDPLPLEAGEAFSFAFGSP